MSKKEILDWFTVNSESLSVDKVLFVLCISLLVGVVIFITYRLAYTGVSYNSRFNAGNVVIVLITSVIMLMISSNMAISLGMVGALSIVRFRTAIKAAVEPYYPKMRVRASNYAGERCEIICEVSARQEMNEEAISALKDCGHVNGVNWLLEMGERIG